MRPPVVLLAMMILVLPGCGEESDSDGGFPGSPAAEERRVQEEARGGPDLGRDRGSLPSPGESRPRAARIAEWSVPKGRWPLTVSEGSVRCQLSRAGAAVTFVTPDGKAYGVNAIALSQGVAKIDPIWRRDREDPGERVDITPLLEAGLRLCE